MQIMQMMVLLFLFALSSQQTVAEKQKGSRHRSTSASLKTFQAIDSICETPRKFLTGS